MALATVPPPNHLNPPNGPPPPIPPNRPQGVNAKIASDISTSFPHLPHPDSIGPTTGSSESLSPSTTTERSTTDTPFVSSGPSLPPTAVLRSPPPTPTTDIPTSSDPFTTDTQTVHLSTHVISESSRVIPPTPIGFSTSTATNGDLIPTSSRSAYTTDSDSGNSGGNPNNLTPTDGAVHGGNPSNAAGHRTFSTGAIVGIVVSLILLCFVGFVFWRRQRQAQRAEHANRWWFSRTRRRPDIQNATERLPTLYSSSLGSSFEGLRSSSMLSNDEFDGSPRPPMVEVGLSARTTPSLSLGQTAHSPEESVLDGSHSLTHSDSRYFVHPDSESSYNESIPPTPVRLQSSNALSETSMTLPTRPPSPKYNPSLSKTSSGRSLTLHPSSSTTRVVIPPIPPLPKSPPPVPIVNPFLDHNPFDDPVHH